MRSLFKYKTLAILFSLLGTVAVIAQNNPSPTPPKNAGEVIAGDDKGLKIEFPEIEGWRKSKVTTYPTAELGYSVNYDSQEAGRVTVYVYNGGLRNISNDVNHISIKSEIARAKGEIQAVGQAGYYDNVKEIKSDTVMLGGEKGRTKAQHSLFNYNANGKPLMSEIYLFGHQNHFIKVRATYLNDETDNKALTDLLLELEELFPA